MFRLVGVRLLFVVILVIVFMLGFELVIFLIFLENLYFRWV